jgi:hypothetical protein
LLQISSNTYATVKQFEQDNSISINMVQVQEVKDRIRIESDAYKLKWLRIKMGVATSVALSGSFLGSNLYKQHWKKFKKMGDIAKL